MATKKVVNSSRGRPSKDVDLIKSVEKLVIRIDHLVELFEEASKHVAEVEGAEIKVQELSKRLDDLLEQNKSIAKGLILLEKYVRGKTRLDAGPETSKLSEYGSF